MSSSIILSQSEYESLIKEIAALKDRITTLTALRDDLIYHICPALRSEYEEKIASLERELFAAQLYLREKQRIIEILQAQINRKQKPSMDEAEQEARKEFEEYQEDLRQKAREAENFQRHWKEDTDWYQHDKSDRKQRDKGEASDKREKAESSGQDDAWSETEDSAQRIGQDSDNTDDGPSGGPETGDSSKKNDQKESPIDEIKRLYRKIVKLLHPDVHPNPTEREKELLNRANDANARGDLEEMRAIWEELSGMDVIQEEYEDTPDGIARMKELIEKLKKRCQTLEQEISHIKSEYPYTMKSFLEDEEAVEEKRHRLKEQIDYTREMDQQLAEYIEELKKKL